MSDAPAAVATSGGDERLSYRSVFQRVFVRPEVGAIIGAIGVWTFFWSVSGTFGTAGQSFAWIDIVASSLGIMAVAIAVLMIGGEFDLSSGAMTGAMAMLVIFMVKETGDLGGLGLPMTLTLPITLAVALLVGYINGTAVERTGQPSFIITLGTFFALIGLKLGLAKRFVGQIQMSSTDEASDFDFWRPIFAGEWERNSHPFEARDMFYISLVVIGIAVIILGVCELWFRRREHAEPIGLAMFGLLGIGVGIGAVVVMHTTDGSAANVVAGALVGVAVIGGLYGFCLWRYEPLT